jgi:putative protease
MRSGKDQKAITGEFPPKTAGRGRRIPELLLPAGGFDAAVAAFEGGADAIYLGLKTFSARKQARNFDELEYRRILARAHSMGRKVFVAINTTIVESELERLCEVLGFLSRFRPDAIIFQDWAVAALAKTSYSGFHLHASTQTALQGGAAIRLAAEFGVERVVLPRETTPLELAGLAEENPDVELEVFAHGALCYSFSGLCLASGLLLGRSGNRGECAQLCRSWYQGTGPGLKGSGYWFSCKDLSLVDRLGELAEAGAACLKIEGRMKSPEYVHAVAALYRGALDRLDGRGPDDEGLAALLEASRLAFSRAPTVAYAGHHAGQDLLDSGFPGHRGSPLGRLVELRGEDLVIELDTDLGLRDGIQILGEASQGTLTENVQFPVLDLRDARSGARIFKAERGAAVLVPLPPTLMHAGKLLHNGIIVSKISSRELDRRAPSPEEFPPIVTKLPCVLSIASIRENKARFALEVKVSPDDPTATSELAFTIIDTEDVTVEKARVTGGFSKALALFSESGDEDFRFAVAAGTVAGEGYSGAALPDLFVPPSELKKLKNRMYATTREQIATLVRERAKESAKGEPASDEASREPRFPLPPRALLVFPDDRIPGGMPFATPALIDAGADLPEYGGRGWLPLAPLVEDTEAYLGAVERRCLSLLDEGRPLMVGLGAFHHLAFARRLEKLAAKANKSELLGFFADIHLYVANHVSLAAFAGLVSGLSFAYRWIEAESAGLASGLPPTDAGTSMAALASVGPGFNAPLFMSKACLLRHHVGKGSCPSPCGKRMTSIVKDRERRYVVVVEDCISLLFAIPA